MLKGSPEHKAWVNAYCAKRKADRKSWALEKLGGACSKCGEKERLQFDHIDPATKYKTIAQLWRASDTLFEAEVAKCQLLCEDCHKTKTRDEQGQSERQHGNEAMYGFGCRCTTCKAGHAEYRRNQRLRARTIRRWNSSAKRG